jgi:signal transduction histidine kinase
MDGGRLGHLGREPDRGLPSNRVYALERHHSGGIWVGTSEGVVLVQNGRVEKRVPLAISALTLHEDADGVLWIGTDGDGLHWLRGETLGSASRAQGLFSNIVFQILEELPAHGGALWMSCNHGLFRVRKSDLFDLQEGRSKRFDVDTITHDDGMEEEEANGGKQPAGWRDGDGALWFATIGGVAKVAPGLFAETRNTEPPVVRIDAVLADGAALADPLAPAAVPPGRGKLEIRYAATSLASPAHIQFRHRLMGFDDDWVDTGEQAVAQYTNLPPGEYRFLVKAGRGRFWSQEKSTGPIELQPHFHQRTSFRAAVALMVVLLGMAAYQARARRWRAETMVLAERNRLAREIHDGLMQGLTGILMQLQAAVALWSAGGGGPLEHVERALEWTRFSLTDARLAVTAMGREIASVKALSEVLQRCAEALTAGTPIRAEVTAAGEDALPPKVGAALLRIGQEAMGNATRHGRPRRVSVEIAAGHAEVRMAVKDDGRGFDPGAEVPGSSNGLRNMRERALAIGGRHEIRSAPGEGTEVIVVAPLAPARRHRPDPLRKS